MPLDATPIPIELRGLRIALLVSGGIAAYKVVDLASALSQAGCQVRVAMTAAAMRFVGPPTFQGVTGKPVATGIWPADGTPEPHVFLGDWAQLILVAPATANVIGRIADGRSDDIVTATLLAARCPVVIAPAMNDAMWAKPALQENLTKLRHRGITVVEPETGHLASGHEGAGRLAGASAILNAMVHGIRARYDLAGRRVVVTAGGTREPIDPVRFISNYSSGKMGFALAAAAADRGAKVTLITTANHPEHNGIDVQRVDTAEEMLAELRSQLRGSDLLLMAAAVGDFRPAKASDRKIRREETPSLTLELEPIPDVVASLAAEPAFATVFRVGFAAEDSKLDAKAMEKVKRKGLQAIVANDISRRDIGFGSEYNAGVLLFADGARHELEKATKRELADKILDLVLPRLKR
ncbi:MAG: bifunctional phosphopantothenoylcysteine decarboxylase/phosphopantothenate--cysteine ligase CoaBC [Chloroflexi bacterium]|nr:MAG: bifunctional phosphopantothenoylcysteine decarboxylase/phosphopantothenate--cysteine ligase CoaBC [Chloroflexota bacterium]TMF74961.1 MAG: bifunctional phosphopantothenoylcysteine decarboxylase/phosphopantothenate--cysteine ligase CoaBC [Chloroflexota bacterium]TMG43617.1 MAG: bifunctional phosphopantothenoylcysteine decarboxylase/phosphopantothenate--cysteine ligase CoaBC [Chloroflexota bacterium]